ncbi:MAG: membrane protein insertion efficiency factor YidD [Planctomycetaceae bacterium]|nr:membrane protein insertion efficiency factor YidD [Planctomycetaceae bacterium]
MSVKILWQVPSLLLIGMVRLYQRLISPFLGPTCRFEPSCSEYFIQAVRKYGPVSGSLRGIWRICRCHPFHPGGYDPP